MSDPRYSRLARFAGLAGTLEHWQRASCAIVGLGGLGGGLALQLARLGVAQLVLVDRDVVAAENLGHQALYTEGHATRGLPKVHAAAEVLAAVNSGVDLVVHHGELTRRSAPELLAGAQLLFDGLDNYYARLVLNDWALSSGSPYFYAGVVRGELSARAIVPGVTGCLRCLIDRPPSPGTIPTCAAEGVFPPLLGIANALQLDLANRQLAGTLGREDDVLYSLDLDGWRWRQIRLSGPRADCPACQGRYEYLDGSLDALAGQSCAGQHAEALLGAPVELAQTAARLTSSGLHVRCNDYCLVVEDGPRRYTVFPSGRITLSGSDDPGAINRFIAEYLGV
jgi:adenylyltransferase/sulfurtransferase